MEKSISETTSSGQGSKRYDHYAYKNEQKNLSKEGTEQQTQREDFTRGNSKTFHECEDRLIRKQYEIIKALEQQISDEEQELYEKDRQIVQLENDLGEICEKLLLEMNLQ